MQAGNLKSEPYIRLMQAGVGHVVLTLGATGAALATLGRNAGAGSAGGAGSNSRGSSGDNGSVQIHVTFLPVRHSEVTTKGRLRRAPTGTELP